MEGRSLKSARQPKVKKDLVSIFCNRTKIDLSKYVN